MPAIIARRTLLLAAARVARLPGTHVRIALNSYSFNGPLRAGSIDLPGLVRFCAEHGIEALDATGYYFPGYPKPPAPEYVRGLKREALVNGVTIFCTGVRNDFSLPDAAARRREVQLVKDWIETAASLGASIIRVFSGERVPAGRTFDEVLEWMAPDLKECAEYGRRHGVVVGLQNHDDFVKTAEETMRLAEAVDSPWFGVVLDVGSLRRADPYAEIEKLLPYAVSWQLKENVGYGRREEPTDLARVKAIIDKAGYRGFLPIETFGDPRERVPKFLAAVRAVFAG